MIDPEEPIESGLIADIPVSKARYEQLIQFSLGVLLRTCLPEKSSL